MRKLLLGPGYLGLAFCLAFAGVLGALTVNGQPVSAPVDPPAPPPQVLRITIRTNPLELPPPPRERQANQNQPPVWSGNSARNSVLTQSKQLVGKTTSTQSQASPTSQRTNLPAETWLSGKPNARQSPRQPFSLDLRNPDGKLPVSLTELSRYELPSAGARVPPSRTNEQWIQNNEQSVSLPADSINRLSQSATEISPRLSSASQNKPALPQSFAQQTAPPVPEVKRPTAQATPPASRQNMQSSAGPTDNWRTMARVPTPTPVTESPRTQPRQPSYPLSVLQAFMNQRFNQQWLFQSRFFRQGSQRRQLPNQQLTQQKPPPRRQPVQQQQSKPQPTTQNQPNQQSTQQRSQVSAQAAQTPGQAPWRRPQQQSQQPAQQPAREPARQSARQPAQPALQSARQPAQPALQPARQPAQQPTARKIQPAWKPPILTPSPTTPKPTPKPTLAPWQPPNRQPPRQSSQQSNNQPTPVQQQTRQSPFSQQRNIVAANPRQQGAGQLGIGGPLNMLPQQYLGMGGNSLSWQMANEQNQELFQMPWFLRQQLLSNMGQNALGAGGMFPSAQLPGSSWPGSAPRQSNQPLGVGATTLAPPPPPTPSPADRRRLAQMMALRSYYERSCNQPSPMSTQLGMGANVMASPTGNNPGEPMACSCYPRGDCESVQFMYINPQTMRECGAQLTGYACCCENARTLPMPIR